MLTPWTNTRPIEAKPTSFSAGLSDVSLSGAGDLGSGQIVATSAAGEKQKAETRGNPHGSGPDTNRFPNERQVVAALSLSGDLPSTIHRAAVVFETPHALAASRTVILSFTATGCSRGRPSRLP